ncbi:MAG: V-type ATPase subunit [Anaerolineae bacterium]|nr:V-type ATPase subunit [Anaerolineae bacterium]
MLLTPRGGISGYAYTHARVRAMYSTLLSPHQWAKLYDAADFDILTAMLKETGYAPYIMVRAAGRKPTPRWVIYQTKRRMADAYMTVFRSVPARNYSLLVQLYRRFEIDNLKAVLRGIETGASWDSVLYVLFPLGEATALPARTMLEGGSVPAAIEHLRRTPYYNTLSHALRRYTAEQSLFPLEVALDLSYWRTLWHEVNQLSRQDQAHALPIVGALLDMNNLMWAIRYREYHHLSEEEIINYTLPSGYRVRDEDIRAIAAGADIAQIVTKIYPELANVDALLREPESGLPALELQLQMQLAEQCRRAFIGYPFHIGIPLAYLVLTELESQDLTVIVEAKSAQMPAERFRSQLLMGNIAHP